MTEIDIDGEEASDGLLALVVAVVELLVEAMEREGIRRMESGQLSDEEVERLGQQFQAIEAEIEDIKDTADIDTEVQELQSKLDGLVDDALRSVDPEGVAASSQPGRRSDRPTATGDRRVDDA